MFSVNLEVVQRHHGLVLRLGELDLHLDSEAHLLLLLLPGLQRLLVEGRHPDLELDEPGPNVAGGNQVFLVNKYRVKLKMMNCNLCQ